MLDDQGYAVMLFSFSGDMGFLAILIAGIIAFLAVIAAVIHHAGHRRRMKGYNFTRMYQRRVSTPWNGLIPDGVVSPCSENQNSCENLVIAEQELVAVLDDMLDSPRP